MVNFIESISKKDISACRLVIRDFIAQLPDKSASWEPLLLPLIKGIELHYDHEILLSLLEELPPEINEALFLRLTSIPDLAPIYLKTLTTHVNQLKPDSHKSKLIYLLLGAPVPLTDQPETMELLLSLSAKEKGIFLTQLQIQTANFKFKRGKITSQSQNLHQIYAANYNQLLLFLTIRASKTESTLHLSLSDDPVLANLLISKLMDANLDEKKQKQLILILLKDHSKFNWEDLRFNAVVHKKLVVFFSLATPTELQQYFKLYVQLSQKYPLCVKNKVLLLDDLYNHTQSVDTLIHCLDAIDDSDHTFTIYFLTRSEINNSALRQACLKRIDMKQLAMFCGHMIAVGHWGNDSNQGLFTDYINIFCSYLTSQHAKELLSQMAYHVSFLPPNEEQLVIKKIINKLSSPEQTSLYLQALLPVYKEKFHLLLPHILGFIKQYPDKIDLITSLIQNLESDQLADLYLQMVSDRLDRASFNCFKLLFQKPEFQHHLFFILKHTPAIDKELLNELINQLDDSALLALIDDLLINTYENTEFKTTINQILLIFCRRLYLNQNPESIIHQWQNQRFTDRLIHHLLDNPECVSNLVVTNPAYYSWLTWSTTATALKYRIDAVLNWMDLEQDKIAQIALNWLESYRDHPEQLHLLFNNLHSSDINRTIIGKKNLSRIKQACWALLKPGIAYKDQIFLTLFKAPTPNLFDPLLLHLAKTEYLQKDPYSGSLWLAKTLSAIPKTMNDETLTSLLIHSVHENTLINWSKAAKWLETRETINKLNCIKLLLKKVCSVKNNPILSQKAYLLITQCPQFDLLLPQLNDTYWYWLFKQSSIDQLNSNASHWLDLILQKHDIRYLNIGKFFSFLPQNEALITELLKMKALHPPEIVAQIIAQLASEPDCITQFIALHHWINKQDKQWIKHFLKIVIPQLRATDLNIVVVHVINSIVMNNSQSFAHHNKEDQKLINDLLILLNTLIQYTEENKKSRELQQLMLSLINFFIAKDYNWNEFIFNHPAVTETVLTWLANSEMSFPDCSMEHPLCQLFIESPPISLDSKLRDSANFQQFTQNILTHHPEKMNSDRFVLLLNLLKEENQISLAKHILAQQRLTKTQIDCIYNLVRILSPNELYQLFEQNKVHSITIARGILTHHLSLSQLTIIQRKKIFDCIGSSHQLLEILISQTPTTDRIAFIQEFFNLYGQDAQSLGKKLDSYFITSDTLAALANFTMDLSHQRLLNEVLQEKTYYRDFIDAYLHKPTLDMPLNENSFLYQITRDNLLSNKSLKPCNAQFIKQLLPEDAFRVLKKSYVWARGLETVSHFYAPFTTGEHVATALLRSARWQQCLILIYNGLLEVSRFYQDKNTPETIRQLIEQTSLYKQLLEPLLIKPDKDLIKNLLPKLFFHLQEYIKTLANEAPSHIQLIKGALYNYTYYLNIIRKYSSIRLYEAFKPDSYIAPVNSNKPRELFTEQISILVKAHSDHIEKMEEYGLTPAKYYSDVLTAALKSEQLTHQEEINKWIFQFALFSPLSERLDDAALKYYISKLNPEQVATQIQIFLQRALSCSKTVSILGKIKSTEPIREFVQQLLKYDARTLNQFITDTDSLNLIFLRDLLNFAFYIKMSELNQEQISALFLSMELSDNQESDWVHLDLHSMQSKSLGIDSRLEQLICMGFSYHKDAQNNERLLQMGDLPITRIQITTLIKCLNSYHPLFSTKATSPDQFLLTLNKILSNSKTANELLPYLDLYLINHIILSAVKDPVRYCCLIEKLLDSCHAEQCMTQLQLRINALIKQNEDPLCADITQLKPEQFEQFTPKKLNRILTLQRLLFYGNPPSELQSFVALSDTPEINRTRRLFCADASLYQSLIAIEKDSQKSMSLCLSWLTQNSRYTLNFYANTIDCFNLENKIRDPAVLYYWLCWNAFINRSTYEGSTLLTKSLLSWLSQMNEHQLESSPDLYRFLEYLSYHNLLNNLFQSALTNKKKLSAPQIAWLCENSLKIAPKDFTLLFNIIKLGSWSWLEKYMKRSSPVNFDLIKIAMGNTDYLKKINNDEKSQLEFIHSLKTSNYTHKQILELISIVQDKQVKSLLIIHLLSQQSYLDSLKGDSVLNRLTTGEAHMPSRLNALIHQLDVTQLTLSQIELVQPEAAVSILCSIPHFHQLTEQQVDSLLKIYPLATVITYWINHFSAMPNAYLTLAHLLKLANSHTISEINKLEGFKKEVLITTMIAHLELFNPSLPILRDQNEETRLILAIKHYLNGHNPEAYVVYIKLLTNRLLNNNHHFSDQAIQLLITLTGKAEFTDLNNKMAYQINYALREQARAGNTGIFYNSFRAYITSMLCQIQLNPIQPPVSIPGKSFISNLLSTAEAPGEPKQEIPVNPLINELAKRNKTVRTFDYFLMHYQGDTKQLNKALTDYLDYHSTEGCTESRRRSIYHTLILMIRPEIQLPVREAIFSSFLRTPELYDEQIAFYMFLFDARRIIQHYGLQGGIQNYKLVLNLCNWALGKLDPKRHQAIIDVATQAQKEATLELGFAEEEGILSLLLRRVKRCWYSGWTGFFSPNLPVYVAIASTNPEPETAAEERSSYKPEPDLDELLSDHNKPLLSQKLDELTEALTNFAFAKGVNDETITRFALHQVFQRLKQDAIQDKNLDNWLLSNQHHLMNNSNRLMELLLIKNNRTEIDALLKELFAEAPHLYHQITSELSCNLPEQKPETPAEHQGSEAFIPDSQPTLLVTATELVTDTWSWARSFFATSPGQVITPPSVNGTTPTPQR